MSSPLNNDTHALLHAVADRAERYLRETRDRAVFPAPEAIAKLGALDSALPEHGAGATEVLEALDKHGSPATVASSGGRYFGFVTGGSLPAALAANWLASTWDQNTFSDTSSPSGAFFDELAAKWTLDVLALPENAAVAFVTGATMANFTCLAAARGAQLARLGWDVEADGLFGAPALDLVVGEEAHAVIYKAIGLLGFGRANVRVVPADDQGRMRSDALGALGESSIVCLQAGNVNTGASDPIREICDAANDAGAWTHVDGAFGLWANAAEETRDQVRGIETASSWATDGHKWLNVPYDCGIAIVRDVPALRRAMAVNAAYLPDVSGRQPIDLTPEASRRARGVDVWAALRSLGRSGVEDLVERTCRYARLFSTLLADAGFRILNEVCLNQVLVSFGSDVRTLEVLERIQRDGTSWCGSTVWHGQTAIRISVSSWATTEDDVRQSAERMIALANAT